MSVNSRRQATLHMSLLILIYHSVSQTDAGRANVHWLSMRQFESQMQHLRTAGYPVLAWREFDAGRALPERMQIALTFDDGNRSDLACARLLHALGLDALFFIVTDYLGQPGYLSREDVVELRRLGMTIGSHSHRHVQLPPLDDAAVLDELRRSRQILEDIVEQPIVHFSFPGGSYDTRTVEMSRRAGYEYLFTSDWGLNHESQSASRLWRRTSVLNHLDTVQFDALACQRNYYARQLGFKTKEWMKASLGVERYVHIRQALLSLRKPRLGR
jgi:peptidoglycan/xylan/chitin deacetylase (PgdA/CDA1 family)